MRAAHVTVQPWDKPCSRCGKPTFEDFLDERGLCAYCREIVAMKTQKSVKTRLRLGTDETG